MGMIDFQYFFHFWVLPHLRSKRGQPAILRFIKKPQPFAGGGGQTAIEYLLMLALVAAMIIIFGVLFNRRLLGGFFSMVGMIIGEGLGKT